MKIIDLTHTIRENIPVYPGTDPPAIKTAASYEEHGFKETLLTMFSHTGTHMDAPRHMFSEGASLDLLPVSSFTGTAVIVDCRKLSLSDTPQIKLEHIMPVMEKADKAEFLLFYTGWDLKWHTGGYFDGFPFLSEEVAKYAVKSGKKGVGTDAVSVDAVDDTCFTAHKILLNKTKMVIVENLMNLGLAGKDLFTFYALPLKYENSDGAPVRALALVNNGE